MIFEQRNKRNIYSYARKTYIQLIIKEKGKDAFTEWKEEREKNQDEGKYLTEKAKYWIKELKLMEEEVII